VVVAGGVLAGTVLASAAAPVLPRQTPAQLLAAMQHVTVLPAMTATISESANLGFPALPDIGMSSSPMSAASLVSGTHTVQVWYAGPRHLRVALPVSFGETDLRVNGSQVWLWDSNGQTATHYIAPSSSRPMRRGMKPAPGTREAGPFAGLSPLQAAQRVLAMVGPTTKVTVPGTVEVAGRAAYELAIAPRTSQSLVGRVVIAVDAKTHLPLSVQVFARGSSSPAFQVGFTSLDLARPAMSNFTFTPPAGAKVKTAKLPAPNLMPRAGGMPGAVRPGAVRPGAPHGRGPLAGAQTFGQGWLTVAAIPASLPASIAGGHASGSAAYQSSLTISGPAGQELGLLRVLAKAATPVHGPWGSGRLLRTALFSVLLTSRGQVLVGAVTPGVLYADAAKVK
jgi:outer membrane lipoprotein-sorting protein